MFADFIQLSWLRPGALLLSLFSMGRPGLAHAYTVYSPQNHQEALTYPTDSLKALKQTYSLRRAVPKARLREMTTDRPDVTESAYSVDAGHFQLETDLVRITRQARSSGIDQQIDFNDINLKVGLNRTADLELVINSFLIHQEPDQSRLQQRSLSAFTLRWKLNLWGNDGGRTALSLISFVKPPIGVPTGETRAWEGGIVTPFAWQLPRDWTLGSQLQASLNYDANRQTHYLQLAPTLTIGHDIYRRLGGFVEVAGYWDVRQPHWQATVNGGPILRLGDNIQFDLGVNLALTYNTPSSYFLGFSFRH